MALAFTPDHLFKILIRRDDDALFVDSPAQDILVCHSGIPIGNPSNVVAPIREPASHNTTGVDVHQKVHLGADAIQHVFTRHEVVCVE